MRKILSIITISFLSFFASNVLASDATCLKTGEAITTVSGNSATQVGTLADSTVDQCSDIPDEYQINFHALALCTADPRDLDFSSCQYMLAPTDTAIAHTIAYPAAGSLDIPEFSIAPGTYPYMMAILSNKLGIKKYLAPILIPNLESTFFSSCEISFKKLLNFSICNVPRFSNKLNCIALRLGNKF